MSFTSPDIEVSILFLLILHVAKLLVKKVNLNFRMHDFINLEINKGPHINFSRNKFEISQLVEYYISFLEALHVLLCMPCFYLI